jgi:hypothetical protein
VFDCTGVYYLVLCRFNQDVDPLRTLTSVNPQLATVQRCETAASSANDGAEEEDGNLHGETSNRQGALHRAGLSAVAHLFADPSTMHRMNSTRFFSADGAGTAGGWLVEMAKNRIRPSFESAQRGTQWNREPGSPQVEAVLHRLLHEGFDSQLLKSLTVGGRPPVKMTNGGSDSDVRDEEKESLHGLKSSPIPFEDLISDVGDSFLVLRVVVIVIDVILIVYHTTRTYDAVRTLYSAGFAERRMTSVADIAAGTCGCYIDIASCAALNKTTMTATSPGIDGTTAAIRYSLSPATSFNDKENFATLPHVGCNGGRSQRCNALVLASSGGGCCIDKSVSKSATSLTTNHRDVGNCVADGVMTSSSQSTTLLLPSSAQHRKQQPERRLQQQQQPIHSVWCTVRDSRRPPAIPPPPSPSSAACRNEYCNAFFRVFWRLASSQRPVMPTICILVATILLVQFTARTAKWLVGGVSPTAEGVSDPSDVMWWLLYAAGFVGPATSLVAHVESSNHFLSAVDDARFVELDTWYRRHMVFELANLRGVIELFDAGNLFVLATRTFC